ncbi:redoxin domain-containing protein [Plantactinospora sp. B6F1]|uniref:redoxin domain-containing protein n=1 Tax=Plantactinospora sp. B6F1 TaxID=3158971 RepID=UPI0032D9339D
MRPGGSLLALVLLAAACTGPDAAPRDADPTAGGESATTTAFADCTTLTAPLATPGTPAGQPASSTAGAPVGSTAGSTAGAPVGSTAGSKVGSTADAPAGSMVGRSLPALRLPCFVGTGEVDVGELRGPAVVNLWASWCRPCRKELPAFQRLTERAGDRLRVVGVNSGDARPAAASIGEDFGLEFPSLYDRDKKLLTELGGRPVLPITLFVDAEGRIRHRDETGALDDAELATLVRRHLGVAVPS